MKRKTSPDSYTARPAPPEVVARSTAHPSHGLAKAIVRWLERGDTPPSVVLTQGLMLARAPAHDGLPVEQTRPGRRAVEGDNRVVMALLDQLKKPGVDRLAVVAMALKAVWVDKRSAPRSTPARSRPAGDRPPTRSTPRTTGVVAPVVIVRRSARTLERSEG